MEKIFEKVQGVDFKDEDFDRLNVIEAIISELKEVEDTHYDMQQLQGQHGIHELKRRLRWFLIYFQGFDGLFHLVDIPAPQAEIPNEYRFLQDHPIAKSRFSQLPMTRNLRPILIPKPLFLALSKLVVELRQIKDEGESIEALAHAFHKTGMSKDAAEARATKVARANGVTGNIYEEASVVQEEMERT